MPTDLDRSRVVCRVCGQRDLLPRDAGAASEELASFSRRHVHRGGFRVDVVVADNEELADPYGVPEQGTDRPAQTRLTRHWRGIR